MEDWEVEKAFWLSHVVDTFDLEHSGGYDSYSELVRQPYTENSGHWGDWVRSEVYRRDVEKLEARIKELEDEINSLPPPAF